MRTKAKWKLVAGLGLGLLAQSALAQEAAPPPPEKPLSPSKMMAVCYGEIANRMAETEAVTKRLAAEFNEVGGLQDELAKAQADLAAANKTIEVLRAAQAKPPAPTK